MSWRYGVTKLEDGQLSICEVYSDKGLTWGYTGPIYLIGETREELIEVMEMALRDLKDFDETQPQTFDAPSRIKFPKQINITAIGGEALTLIHSYLGSQ